MQGQVRMECGDEFRPELNEDERAGGAAARQANSGQKPGRRSSSSEGEREDPGRGFYQRRLHA